MAMGICGKFAPEATAFLLYSFTPKEIDDATDCLPDWPSLKEVFDAFSFVRSVQSDVSFYFEYTLVR